MEAITCKRCGSPEEVSSYSGIPLCVDCVESAAYDAAFPPGDNFSTLFDTGLDG